MLALETYDFEVTETISDGYLVPDQNCKYDNHKYNIFAVIEASLLYSQMEHFTFQWGKQTTNRKG